MGTVAGRFTNNSEPTIGHFEITSRTRTGHISNPNCTQIVQMLPSRFTQLALSAITLHDHLGSQQKRLDGLRDRLGRETQHRRQHVQSNRPVAQQSQILLLNVIQAKARDSFDLTRSRQMLHGDRVATLRRANSIRTLK